MIKVYRSKIDWIVSVPALALALALGLSARMMLAHESGAGGPVVAFAVAVSLGLLLWTILGTSYLLDDERLRVRSGPFSWQIALRDIRSVAPTRDPRSSPALSLDRLRIEYGSERALMVSPRDKAGFLRDLERRRRDAAARCAAGPLG